MRQILTGVVTLILGFFTLVFAAVFGLLISVGALIAKPFVIKNCAKRKSSKLRNLNRLIAKLAKRLLVQKRAIKARQSTVTTKILPTVGKRKKTNEYKNAAPLGGVSNSTFSTLWR